MADFMNNDVFNSMPGGNPGINMGTTGSMHEIDWGTEGWTDADREHWQRSFSNRPYVQADRGFAHYEPAYRYGTTAARQHASREWHDAEGDLERGWDKARGTSQSAWHEAKDAVRDAWDHVRGRR